MNNHPNPYAPPKHDGPGVRVDSALEAIRREHINAETSVKTVAILLYLGALGSLIGGATTLDVDPTEALVSIVIGVALVFGGYWLRQLDRRGRVLYTVVAAFGILRALVLFSESSGYGSGAALGTMFWPLVLLAFLWVPKASTVMTPHYRDVVIPATPHVKRETSPLVIVLGVILLALLVYGIVMGAR